MISTLAFVITATICYNRLFIVIGLNVCHSHPQRLKYSPIFFRFVVSFIRMYSTRLTFIVLLLLYFTANNSLRVWNVVWAKLAPYTWHTFNQIQVHLDIIMRLRSIHGHLFNLLLKCFNLSIHFSNKSLPFLCLIRTLCFSNANLNQFN